MNFKFYPNKLVLPAFLATMALAAGSVMAQSSDNATTTDYSSFQVIPQLNIFNPSREPNRPMDYRRAESQAVPEFTLAGTMSYRKGMFAFFNGTDPDYQKAVQEGGTIAGFTVTNISLNGIQLFSPSMNTNMMVGAAMQLNGTNWDLNNDGASMMSSMSSYSEVGGSREGRGGRGGRGNRERRNNYDNTAPAVEESAPAPSSGLNNNDTLKRLMQQRQQEEK